MCTKLTLIYLLSVMLFFSHLYQEKKYWGGFFYKRSRHHPIVTKIITSKRQKLNLPLWIKELTLALIFGEKRKIPRHIMEPYKMLGLLHLFTPSGLHLSSLLFLFHLITIPLKKFSFLRQFLSTLIPTALFIFPGFYSLKRITLLRIAFFIQKHFPRITVNHFEVFLMTFFIDFVCGTFNHSPLSYSFSFIFLGAIFSQLDKPKFCSLLALQGAMIISNFFSNEVQYLPSLFLNFPLTAIFSLIYPVIFVSFIFNLSWPIEKLLNYFNQAVQFSCHIFPNGPYISSNILLLSVPLIISLSITIKTKLKYLMFFFIFYAGDVGKWDNTINQNFLFSKKPPIAIPIDKPYKKQFNVKARGERYILFFEKAKCMIIMQESFDQFSCRKLRHKKKKKDQYFNKN